MRLAIWPCLIFGMAVAGCSAAPESNEATRSRATTVSAAQRFANLSPEWRRAMALRAITDTGQTCDSVMHISYQQEVRGMAMWTAQCHDGGRWAVYIGEQGYAQAGRCQDLAASGLPPCETAEAKKRG